MARQNLYTKVLLIGLILAVVLTGCAQTSSEASKQKLTIGVLPTEDSLPLVVAKQMGYFDDRNLDVELVTFQSAVESQSAIQSGQIDGMITDMIVATLLKDSGLDLKMTSITYGSSKERRRFAIVAAPNSGIETVADLKGKSIGISNNSIIEYITDKLLDESSVSRKNVEKTAIPKIPVRLELLLNNKIDAANIPEPLVTFAEAQGAKVIIDDTTNTALSKAVIVLTEQTLQTKSKEVKDFYSAYGKAVQEINANPNQYKETSLNNINIPKQIADKYQVPTYPELQLPSENEVNDVLEWLNEKGLLTNSFGYKDLIQTELY